MAETYVAAAMAAVAQQRPRTQISVRVDHWQQLNAWALAGELDFYVADVGDARLDGRFHYTSLPSHSFAWFCRHGHPLVDGSRDLVTRGDLMRFPIATPRMPPWASEWFAAVVGEDGVEGLPRPFPAIECESYAMLKRIVSSSDCISTALEQTLANEVAEKSLVILPVDAPQLTTHAGIVRLDDRPLSPLGVELTGKIVEFAAR